jgi:epsilon-lactone hydrolase
MPSQQMREKIATLRAQREAAAGQPAPTLAETRANFDKRADLYPLPADAVVTQVDAGGVPAGWISFPGADAGRALLYLHGGGYQVGSFLSHAELAYRLGRASGSRVLLPEYRLAPEHPFPAAVDDALAVWRWLRTAEGLNASALTVAGDSAGGGLAVAMMTALRDGGEDLPAAAVLVSPWTDLSCSGASVTERVGEDPIFVPGRLEQLAADYLAGADPRTPLASPLFARLDRLPPLLIQVGTAEMLLSDAEDLGKAAAAAGVDVTVQTGDGLPHVYPGMLGTPEATGATDRAGAFLRDKVSPGRLCRPMIGSGGGGGRGSRQRREQVEGAGRFRPRLGVVDGQDLAARARERQFLPA